MKTVWFLYVWLRRIPARFTVVFLTLFLASMALVSWVVAIGGVDSFGDLLWRLVGAPPELRDRPTLVLVSVLWEALVVVLFVVVGTLLAYNLTVPIYRLIRRRPRIRVVGPAEPEPGGGKRLDRHQRIGIILAGGGAKGAFQAGALRAIYEFLEANDALDKVRMIAGTSIGSWNAMFWLAGLVKPAADGMSLHERWWRSIDVERIVEFAHYLPLRRNYFLTPRPWRDSFRQIFTRNDDVRQRLASLYSDAGSAGPPIHFYFTRSNVALGRLEFSTNRPDLHELRREHFGPQGDFVEPVVDPEDYEIIAGDDLDTSLERTGRAVFASMDLPPLFPYAQIKVEMNEWFEDGGVVENVPIRFGTELENCDLLFVLALNASFTEDVNQTSIVRRLFRVMNVRQGVLERNSFKMIYLYNELAGLRQRTLEQRGEGKTAAPREPTGLEERPLRRKHRPVAVFSVCPDPPLVIDTVEFWNRDGAARAFEVMYAATKYELESNFERNCRPEWIRMTLVNAHGERRYLENF